MSETINPKLREAAATMLLASIDYDDNKGSEEAMLFWDRFEKARDNYKLIKKETCGKVMKPDKRI